MRQLYDDLWQTDLEMRFSTLITHAYLLEREQGNVLFYTTNNQDELAAIADEGGVAYQYMSHCHEVDDSQAHIKSTLGCQLCGHALVESYFRDSVSLDVKFANPDREVHSDNIEVIHTPGHTNNSVCYFYRSPHGRNYLFPGDVIYLDQGEWKTLIVEGDGGNLGDMVNSLKLLRTLEVDVIICSVAMGAMEIVEVADTDWFSIIDGALASLSDE